MAVITKEHWGGQGVVVYRCHVGQKVYTGQDRRSWQNPKYAHVMPSEESVVYSSSSHPCCRPSLPRNVVIEGQPVVLLAWLIEAGLVVALMNPKSPRAFRFSGRRGPLPTKEACVLGDANTIATAEEVASGSSRPWPQFDGWELFKDKLWLVGCGVLAMAAIAIIIDTVFGRK